MHAAGHFIQVYQPCQKPRRGAQLHRFVNLVKRVLKNFDEVQPVGFCLIALEGKDALFRLVDKVVRVGTGRVRFLKDFRRRLNQRSQDRLLADDFRVRSGVCRYGD